MSKDKIIIKYVEFVFLVGRLKSNFYFLRLHLLKKGKMYP